MRVTHLFLCFIVLLSVLSIAFAQTEETLEEGERIIFFSHSDVDRPADLIVRLRPTPYTFFAGSRVQINLPKGTRLAVDYPDVTCSIRIETSVKRVYTVSEMIVSTKRAGSHVSYISFVNPADFETEKTTGIRDGLLFTCSSFYPTEVDFNSKALMWVENGKSLELDVSTYENSVNK